MKTTKKVIKNSVEKKVPKKLKPEKAKKILAKKKVNPKKNPVKKVLEKKEKGKIKDISITESGKGVEKKTVKPTRYFEGVGRRKSAVARVRLFTQGEKDILVNKKPYKDYFSILEYQQTVIASLEKMKSLGRFSVSVKVKGGGLHAQAEAIRHGAARALLKFNPDFRKKLRKAGFLTRDPRARERKKFGLKRARRAPQWRKR